MQQLTLNVVSLRVLIDDSGPDRIWIETDLPDGCWPYTGHATLDLVVAHLTAQDYVRKNLPQFADMMEVRDIRIAPLPFRRVTEDDEHTTPVVLNHGDKVLLTNHPNAKFNGVFVVGNTAEPSEDRPIKRDLESRHAQYRAERKAAGTATYPPKPKDSITSIVEAMVAECPDGPLKSELSGFKSGVFLELPERRSAYIIEVGSILRRHLGDEPMRLRDSDSWERKVEAIWFDRV